MLDVRVVETDTIHRFNINKAHKEFIWWSQEMKQKTKTWYLLGNTDNDHQTVLFKEFEIRKYLKK